ncbi:MAG TPA: hypothetical protein VKE93_01255 [Candidatus Angelobacter sp.]|nr:hypothetical protein [Candidatus Angelobacter sp.]
MIAIMVAPLTSFLQLAALLFGLTAVLAMSADGLLQVFLRLVDAAFALIIAIHRRGWNGAAHQEKKDQDHRQKTAFLCHKTLRSGGVVKFYTQSWNELPLLGGEGPSPALSSDLRTLVTELSGGNQVKG